jgi:hypothetical protein
MRVRLQNDDDHFGVLLANETLLSARMNVAIGYRALRRDKFMARFQGMIVAHTLTRDDLSIVAEAT